MEDNWIRSDCVTVEGFPQLLWETLQRLGYTEPPMYYGREYEEGDMLKCEVHLHVPQHPSGPGIKSRCVTAFGRELSDTCQIAARQALMDYCQMFEEDIEHTPARFFPVVDQTTPTWTMKVRDLEDIGRHMPNSTMVSTVKYLHALDSLYEDQRQELKKWIKKARKAEDEVRKWRFESYLLEGRLANMRKKKQEYLQQLHEARDQLRYRERAQEINKRKRTFAMSPEQEMRIPGRDPRGKARAGSAYDPENPRLNHAKSEESVADNFNRKATKGAMTTGPSPVSPRQGADDGYANNPWQDADGEYVNDLYAL